MKLLSLIGLIVSLGISVNSWAGAVITYHGRILDPAGRPVERNSVTFKIKVLSPNPGKCLLYEESRTISMVGSNGVFVIPIGDGLGNRTANDPGIVLEKIFLNDPGMTFNVATYPKLSCNSGSSYTPSLLDQRQLVVSFDENSGLGEQSLPNMDINYVPFSVNAHDSQNIGGTPASSVLRLTSGAATPLTPANFTELLNLLSGASSQYAKPGQLNGAAVPTLANGEVLGWDGSAWKGVTVGGGGGGATGAAGGHLAGTYPNPTLANDVITNDHINSAAAIADSKLATITTAGKVSGGAITSGTISGSTAINTTGNVTAANLTASSASLNSLLVYKTGNTNKVTIQAPASLATDYVLTLPATSGAEGQVLSMGAGGVLAWSNAASGSVTAVTGNAPLSSSGGATPAISISKADGSTDGYVSSTDWTSFNSKQNGSSSLTNFVSLIGTGLLQKTGADTYAALGTSAPLSVVGSNLTIAVGDTAGSVAAGNDARFPSSVCASGNKSRWNGTAWVCEGDADSWTSSSGNVYRPTGNVGVGVSSPAAKLEVQGQILSQVYNAGSSTSIDWNNGNMQVTSASCGAFTFSNMLEGGSYTLIVTGATSGTCTFAQSSPDAVSTWKFLPANTTTISGSHAVYSFVRANNIVYISWMTGF